jgi:apolipoprotein N-acyltransferase
VSRFKSLADRIAALPRLTALVSGLVAGCGFEPLHFWPLALIAIAALVWLTASAPGWRAAAWRGWLFGFAHFTFSLNWIATAFTFQSEMPAVLGWAAVPLLSVYLAVFPAIACGVARALGGNRSAWAITLALSGTWIVTEWLRSWVFTGFSWNPLGSIVLGDWDARGLAAISPITGTYGLSGFVVLLAGAGWLALRAKRMVPLGIGAALVSAGMLWPAGEGAEGTLPFTLVQPLITQDEINDPTQFEAQFARLARLSADRRAGGPSADRPRLVLWPESAVPDYLEPGYPQRFYDRLTWAADPRLSRLRIGRVLGPGGKVIAGVVNLKLKDGRVEGAYNSALAIDSSGRIEARYDKAHLVPYGEYLPMRPLLEPLGLSRLVAGTLDFEPGPGARTIDLGAWGRAGMQICYEIIFSGQVVDRDDRPDFIFNPSNDGWFGGFGSPQFVAQSRLRAMEEGLPVLRSTTTGISAVIDARGILRASIGRGQADRIDGLMPPPFAPTLFARLGNLLPLIWGAIALLAAAVATRRASR